MLVRHHVHHATIGTHLQTLQFALALEHRMSRQFTEHIVDHLFGAERFAAGDAIERLGLIEHNLGLALLSEQEAR